MDSMPNDLTGPDPEVYVDVALNLPLREAFAYRVPEGLDANLEPGMLVRVPFGKRSEIGCVVGVRDCAPEVDPEKIRPVLARVSPEYSINSELLGLAQFVVDYYCCSLGEILAAISVVGFKDVRTQSHPEWKLREDWRAFLKAQSIQLTARQMQACEELAAKNATGTRAHLSNEASCTASVIQKIEDVGVLTEARPSWGTEEHVRVPAPSLLPTLDQQKALDVILDAARAPRFQVFLLHGVTGSGKTEIYLQTMAEVLTLGRTVMCLVPEIALTPQTVQRFTERFGEEIGVFHSQMTRRAKLILFRKIQAGGVRIVIGARSAVFAGLPNLGLIVIDEEHDGSYKQSETPRYHARDVAIVRAQRLGVPVILGSATPSLESYYNASQGKSLLIKLSARAQGMELPPVRVVDLAREMTEASSGSYFSRALVEAIRERLKRGEQSLLFLNRRGFSNFLFCPSCKWVARCDEDDVALTVHTRNSKGRRGAKQDAELDLFLPDEGTEEFQLRCHFCGTSHPAPKVCPECKNDSLITVGAGTQRIEEELVALFSDARVLRLDYDTAGGREAFLAAWNKMVNRETDIILGTQMIAKGIHLESVTLVGVILADVGLFLPDFRAEERTFTLLTQVAGRAGRVSAGDVIFQTYMPNHTAIRYATQHDYEGFYAEELARRRQLGFPPFTRLVAITLSDVDREKAFQGARLLAHYLNRYYRGGTQARRITINGPTIAPLARLGGRFRYRILMRAASVRPMTALLEQAMGDRDFKLSSSTRLTIDVDPLDLL